MFVSLRKQLSGPVFRGRRLIVFAILLSALLSGMAAPGARAQTPTWNGKVEIGLANAQGQIETVLTSRSSSQAVGEEPAPLQVNFNGTKSFTYYFRLTEEPVGTRPGNWYVMIRIGGMSVHSGRYKGFKWSPPIGRPIDRYNWNQWKSVRVEIDDDYDAEANGPPATSLTLSLEVWDGTGGCPLHNAGRVTFNRNGNGGGPINTGNNAPVFSDSSATRELQENIGDATVTTAANLGAAIRADDSDNDPLTYTLEGSDSASFTIVEQTGQLRTKAGVNYNHEAKSTYRFTIRASDSAASDTIAVTVRILDEEERPLTPAAPVVSSVANSATSLSVSWTPPANTGRPRITSYDLQYREGTSDPWTEGPQNVTGTSRTIPNLNSGHGLPSAGACQKRRGRERLVRARQRADQRPGE